MGKNMRWVYKREIQIEPQLDNFELLEEDIPPLKEEEVMFEALYLSVDPFMKAYAMSIGFSTGQTMYGFQVARIVESKNKDYKAGRKVIGNFGWQLFTVGNPETMNNFSLLPDLLDLPDSLALGVLGILGNTAYFGFLEICNPKAGDVVVVSGAAGAVGSHVGQIAKIKGCHVIGITGSDDKVAWLKNELSFDGAINYKTQNVAAELKKLAPNGVDCYFDNVGGEISSQVLYQMNHHGRVSVCGAISSYNNDLTNLDKASIVQIAMIKSEVRMEGFIVSRWKSRWNEGTFQNMQWVKEGKLKYQETITEGFLKMPEAFIKNHKGQSIGKSVVKV